MLAARTKVRIGRRGNLAEDNCVCEWVRRLALA